MTIDAAPTSGKFKPARKRFRSRWLNADLRTWPGTAARRITETIHEKLLAQETRGKGRREADAKRFANTVDMLAANLVKLALRYPIGDEDTGPAWLSYTRSKQRKQGQKSFPRSLVRVVDAMRDAGLVELRNAIAHSANKIASRMRPADAFLVLVNTHVPAYEDLIDTAEQPLIRLRDTRIKSDRSWHKEDARGPLIRDYKPTEETERWAREIEHINMFLARATITYEPDLASAELERRGQSPDDLPPTLPVHERTMRRTFLRQSWREGGRLSGGFWMHADRRTRLGLRVATEAVPTGEPLVLLDYASAFIQLLYAVKAGVQADREADHYEGITGPNGSFGEPWPDDPVAKLALRTAIKRNVNALFFRDEADAGPRRKIVRGTREALDRYGGGISVAELDARIRRRHPEIAEWIGTEVGYELFFWESQTMLAVLSRCVDESFVALPLHDGVLVPASRADDTRSIMYRAFFDLTGGFLANVSATQIADLETDTAEMPGAPLYEDAKADEDDRAE